MLWVWGYGERLPAQTCTLVVAGIDDAAEQAELASALSTIGVTDREQQCIYRTVAGVLELGQATFEANAGASGDEESAVAGGLPSVEAAAAALAWPAEQLAAVLLTRRICARDEWCALANAALGNSLAAGALHCQSLSQLRRCKQLQVHHRPDGRPSGRLAVCTVQGEPALFMACSPVAALHCLGKHRAVPSRSVASHSREQCRRLLSRSLPVVAKLSECHHRPAPLCRLATQGCVRGHCRSQLRSCVTTCECGWWFLKPYVSAQRGSNKHY